ncbi:MAG: hypothetical protein QM791_17325 [Ferruginibacter sp.]
MNRKNFLQQFTLGTGAIAFAPLLMEARNFSAGRDVLPDPLPADKVKEFVIAGHGNFDKVKSLLAELPQLLYATWDWGGGDFETALEGAGHVGNKEIANHLVGLGARTNVFVLTMLGKTALVKPFLETYPAFINARGPHGLTLLHHAQKGGEDAKELLEYIQGKGLTETKKEL